MAGIMVYTIYRSDGKGGKIRACNKGPYYGGYIRREDAENARLKLKDANNCWIDSSMQMG